MNEAIAGAGTGCVRRRALLAGALGLAGTVSACSTGTPTPSGVSGSTSSERSGTGTGVLASTGDVPVGGGAVVDGVLVVQPTAGTYKAYDAACPHQGVLLGVPSDGVSTCPGHNARFAIADGSRVSGPVARNLTEVPIRVDRTYIVRA